AGKNLLQSPDDSAFPAGPGDEDSYWGLHGSPAFQGCSLLFLPKRRGKILPAPGYFLLLSDFASVPYRYA
ncbi:MAG TPA: hypothetical protein DCG87_06970, partial [Synergistaceae bacterium]|nr:hypothetical protein [Synergistaceae bacterium]